MGVIPVRTRERETTMESNKVKGESRQNKKKEAKGCFWNWLSEAEIKTYQAWNKETKE